ncbi:MAG: tetratricopeptide repeat protein [Bacteroidales bacterium]|nr:tetratricopeptide repeat protein [Candidatus Hennigimonas equi]
MRNKGLYLAFLCLLSGMVFCGHVTAGRQAEALLLSALEAYQKGDMKGAGNLLQQAGKLDPDNDAVYYYMGYIAVEANDARGAVENFEKAYALDSTNRWYATRLASIYAAVGRTEQAERMYVSLRSKRPGDSNVISALSDIYMRERKFDLADSLLTRLEVLEGDTEYTIMSRIELSRMQGRFDEFFDRLNNLFAMDAMPAVAKKDMLDRVIKGSDPRFNYVHLKDYERLVRTCLRTEPADTSVTHYAGGFFYSLEKEAALDSLSLANPDDSYLASLVMYVQFNKGRYEEALHTGTRILETMDSDENLYVGALTTRADCYYFLGRHEDSFREYDRILKQYPDNVTVLNNYAYYLSLEDRNLGKAARMSQRAIAVEPENAVYLDTYAWILFKQRKYTAAKAIFKKAMLYGGKEHPEILRHYAEVLEKLGEKNLADGYRQQAAVKENEKKK